MTDFTALRTDAAIPNITAALDTARAQAQHYRTTGTGWACDHDMAMFFEGREAALVYVLNLLLGYDPDR